MKNYLVKIKCIKVNGYSIYWPTGLWKGTQANILKDTILPNLNIITVSTLLKEKSQDESILGKR